MKFDAEDIAELFDEAQGLAGCSGWIGGLDTVKSFDDVSKLRAWEAGISPEELRFRARKRMAKQYADPLKRLEIINRSKRWAKENPGKAKQSKRKYARRKYCLAKVQRKRSSALEKLHAAETERAAAEQALADYRGKKAIP